MTEKLSFDRYFSQLNDSTQYLLREVLKEKELEEGHPKHSYVDSLVSSDGKKIYIEPICDEGAEMTLEEDSIEKFNEERNYDIKAETVYEDLVSPLAIPKE